jgi:pimeloyl-ACP methyl ester carboxylesterase
MKHLSFSSDSEESVTLILPKDKDGKYVRPAAVVVFLHGYGARNSRAYGGWLKHMARRGLAVLFPIYQKDMRRPETYADGARRGIARGVQWLAENTGLRLPAPAVVIGHSLGGVLAVELALPSSTPALRVVAVMSVEPGDTNTSSERMKPIMNDPRKLPADLYLVCVIGDQDALVGAASNKKTDSLVASKLIYESTQIPKDHKVLFQVNSDDHGDRLVADHSAPLSFDDALDNGNTPPLRRFLLSFRMKDRAKTNALDTYAFWKWGDALSDYVSTGQKTTMNRYIFSRSGDALFMGHWSDGKAVRPVTVLF